MAKVTVSARLDASADAVWRVVGDFDGLPRWHEWIEASRLAALPGGLGRVLQTAAGAYRERLVHYDLDARAYAYQIVSAPDLSLADYRTSIRVSETDDGQGCAIEPTDSWTANDATLATDEAKARAFHEAGVAGLKRLLGG